MPIYLDHAATTPLRSEALEAMLPWLSEDFGNPSSSHSFGRKARAGLDEAHERIARAIGAQAREIVITSGGSESNNLAIKGAAWAGKARGHRIVSSAVEHHSVGHTLRYLEKFGFEIVELPVDRYGRVDPDELEAAITPRRSSSPSWRPTTKSARSSRSPRSPSGCIATRASCSTRTPRNSGRTARST